MEIDATLRWEEETVGEGDGSARGTGPLPYLSFEYRRLFSEHWRFNAGLGWLYVEIDDIKGGQWIGRASIEYLLGRTWGFGAALNLSTVDVDWKNLENDEGQAVLTGAIKMDIHDISLFVRVRFQSIPRRARPISTLMRGYSPCTVDDAQTTILAFVSSAR